jgi:signal transduction histidine kinase
MIKESLHHNVFRLIKAIGVWTSGCLVLSLLIVAVIYFRVGAIINNDALAMVDLSGRQRMLVAEITKSALEIEIALRTEDWDTLEPTLDSLTADRILWQESHDSLKASPMNSFKDEGTNTTIYDYFDRINYPYSQISQATEEIEIVTRSVIRRAPYIDMRSHDRIVAATRALRTLESDYLTHMNEVVKLYDHNAAEGAILAVRAIHKSLLFMLATLAATFFIGIAPRYWLLVAKNTRLEDDIKRAHEAANKRWHFLASLGHEFRTPMSTIMGFAGILANEDQDQSTKEQHAETIIGSGRGLMVLIQDIIDMSAIEADELQVIQEPADPRQIIGRLEDSFSQKAEENSIEFRTHIDQSCPASITTDEKRLEQILTKIIGNAFKFTKTGSVDIYAALETMDSKEMLLVRVVDTGIGIEFNDINRIFEPFERVENGMIRDYGGSRTLPPTRW